MSARFESGARPLAAAPAALDPRFARPRTIFFGIGAQKAATSWLHVYLRGHPEVCVPLHKEQHYWTALRAPEATVWGRRVDFHIKQIKDQGLIKRLLRSPRRRASDKAWQLAGRMFREHSSSHSIYAEILFQNWRGQPVLGEITPSYALLPTSAFAEMAALARDVRFIFIMRDPLDRLISLLRMVERKGTEQLWPDLLAEVLREPNHQWILRSRYDETINQLEAAVPSERIAYFFYETMFQQSEIDRLCDFLSVGRHPAEFDRRVHADPRANATLIERRAEAQALEVLAPTYSFVRSRFGDRVPDDWRMVSA